jgi:hypothetical protein
MFYYGHNAYTSQKTVSSWYSTNKLHLSKWTSNVSVLKKFLTSAEAGGGSEH